MCRLNQLCYLNPETLSETTNPELEFDYVDISSVGSDVGIRDTQALTFADAPSRARRIVRENDVIISTVRTYLKAVAIIPASQRLIIVSTGFAVLRPKEGVDPRYLLRVVQSEGFLTQVARRSNGVSYPAINASSLVRISVPSPSLPEQRRIVRHLDGEISHVEDLIASCEQTITYLKERRTALISDAIDRLGVASQAVNGGLAA